MSPLMSGGCWGQTLGCCDYSQVLSARWGVPRLQECWRWPCAWLPALEQVRAEAREVVWDA